MEDRAPPRAFAKFAEVWRDRCGGDRDERGVAQHGLGICGNLYADLVEGPLAFVLELLRASFIFVKDSEGFHVREHGQEESNDLEIDQAAPNDPDAADFVAAEQTLGGQGRA